MAKDIRGQWFGEWFVLSDDPVYDSGNSRQFRCLCSCGGEYWNRGHRLWTGKSDKCKVCAKKEQTEENWNQVRGSSFWLGLERKNSTVNGWNLIS